MYLFYFRLFKLFFFNIEYFENILNIFGIHVSNEKSFYNLVIQKDLHDLAFNKQNESTVNQLDESIITISAQENISEAYNKLGVIDQSQEFSFDSVSLNTSSLNAQQESSPTSVISEERNKKKRNKKKNQSDQAGEANSNSLENASASSSNFLIFSRKKIN